MNYEPMTTVEKRVQRNRRIRWLIIGLLILWGIYCWSQWGFVLADTVDLAAVDFAAVESMIQNSTLP